MNGIDFTSDPVIRLSVFILLLALLALLENISPRRKPRYSKGSRWISNFGISILNSTTVAMILPIVGAGAALLADERNWGLFNRLDTPALFSIPLYIIAFDLTIYVQHRLFHKFKPLWRLHRMHHTDLDYDVSTGVRFHPLSIFISAGIKLGLILALGPLAIAVIVSEIVLNATSMFNHSNIKLPHRLDAALRYFIVTPDMHRIHHSVIAQEHNRNFGFNFPWWDKIFNTYKDQPSKGQDAIDIGISGYEEDISIGILPLLIQPFRKDRESHRESS
jgi:sterol desaturase/sphingolipid hydroxylase (fatty acid hydroxylase superfamily)